MLFCPYTPFSRLKRKLQATEDQINGSRAVCRVKVVERAGPTIGSLLYNKTPWTKDPCGRSDCKPCQAKPGGCKSPNVTYRIKCQECQKSGKKSHYIGESHRTLYDRAKEHNTALRNQNTTYSIVKHWKEHHQEMANPPEFSYHLVGKHHSAMERQIKEGLLIESESNQCDLLMNGKGEWGINVVPRLQTERDRLGINPEDSNFSTISTGKKRQAGGDLQATQASKDTCTNTQCPSSYTDEDIQFNDQFKQRRKRQRTERVKGQTRPMVRGSSLGIASNAQERKSSEVELGNSGMNMIDTACKNRSFEGIHQKD